MSVYINTQADPDSPEFQIALALRMLAIMVEKNGGSMSFAKEQLCDQGGAFLVEVTEAGVKISVVPITDADMMMATNLVPPGKLQ